MATLPVKAFNITLITSCALALFIANSFAADPDCYLTATCGGPLGKSDVKTKNNIKYVQTGAGFVRITDGPITFDTDVPWNHGVSTIIVTRTDWVDIYCTAKDKVDKLGAKVVAGGSGNFPGSSECGTKTETPTYQYKCTNGTKSWSSPEIPGTSETTDKPCGGQPLSKASCKVQL